ncbi:hypothetical protein GTA08_BOTSDO08750 [Botryosphaeria dothidea]|uniref:Uncharacterized protein n=1 Tax=Botryosphaeria dothidea TaxID=55169 RepID=A0A8H4IN35_9PEZI|nr:hypothetical protein GTA08_BOTSDO08750 [Botryosphaeria dothidea]
MERLEKQLEEAEDAEVAARARARRLRKQLSLMNEKRKKMFDRELASIEELEKLEKEDRDKRRAAGEDVPTPERSPEPESSSGGPPANSVAGIAFPSGAELTIDPFFWVDPVSAGDQGSGDGIL